jgi:hypothetical protein
MPSPKFLGFRALVAWVRDVRNWEPLGLFLLLLLASAIRLRQLGAESLWLDEATTYHRSRLPFLELVADAKDSHHNPGYFLLIGAWLRLGDSELMLRLPSALFGIAKVFVVYVMGRIVAGRWVGLGAGLVIALNPGAVQYDQEARMYALYALGASLGIAGLVWLVHHPQAAALRLWRLRADAAERGFSPNGVQLAWAAFTLGSVVTLYCHATAVLYLAACSLVALVFLAFRAPERRSFLLNWVIANLAALVAFGPWLPLLLQQTAVVGEEGFWVRYPSMVTVLKALKTVYLFGPSNWTAILIAALAAAGTFELRKKPLVLTALWLLTLLGPALLLLASLYQPIFMARQFLWAAAPFSVLVGAGLVAVKPLFARPIAPLAFVALGAFLLEREYYAPVIKPRWREAILLIGANLGRKDVVLATGRRERRLFEYYFHRRDDSLPAFPYRELGRGWSKTLGAMIAEAPAVWSVHSGRSSSLEKVREALRARGKWDFKRSYGRTLTVDRFAIDRRIAPVAEKKGRNADKKRRRRSGEPSVSRRAGKVEK